MVQILSRVFHLGRASSTSFSRSFFRKGYAAVYAVALMMTITPTHAGNLTLEPFSAVYSARYSGITLEATRTLSKTGKDQWEMTTAARNFMGQINETSRFTVNGGTVQSDYYRYKRRVLGSSKQEEQLFDWDRKVSGYYVDRGPDSQPRREIPLTQPLFDRSNYQLQLIQDLRDGIEELSYQIADRGRQREYRFERLGSEILETPTGEIETVKVIRVREDDDRETILWFAPELNYLLIQMEHTEDGHGSHTLRLVRIDHVSAESQFTATQSSARLTGNSR